MVRPFLKETDCDAFATRSPARPNHIGMSPVRLPEVHGSMLLVADVAAMDGAPLLDIKPYVPAFDHFSEDRVGWYENTSPTGAGALRHGNSDQENRVTTCNHDDFLPRHVLSNSSNMERY